MLNLYESGRWKGQFALLGELFPLRLCNSLSSMFTVPSSRETPDQGRLVYQHSFSQASSLRLLPTPSAHHCRSSSDSGCSQQCLTILIGTILVLIWVLYWRRFACRDSVTVRASGLRNDGYILPKELGFHSSAIKNLDNDKFWLVFLSEFRQPRAHAPWLQVALI